VAGLLSITKIQKSSLVGDVVKALTAFSQEIGVEQLIYLLENSP